jgi:hypothetical protein
VFADTGLCQMFLATLAVEVDGGGGGGGVEDAEGGSADSGDGSGKRRSAGDATATGERAARRAALAAACRAAWLRLSVRPTVSRVQVDVHRALMTLPGCGHAGAWMCVCVLCALLFSAAPA